MSAASLDSPLPDGWAQSTLGDIGKYHNGRGFKKSEWRDSGWPIIRIQNLTDPSKGFNYFQGEVDERHEVTAGDLLVSWAATLDIFRWDGPDGVLNQHIFRVDSHINRDFHYYLLKNAVDALRRESHGAGMVHITRSRFEAIPVAVPPAAEQERIVARLASATAEVADGETMFKRAAARLEPFKSSTLRAVLRGEMTTLSAETRDALREAVTRPLRDIADIQYGWTAKADPDIQGPQMLRITDIQDGAVDWESVPRCEVPDEKVAQYLLELDDILFARIGATTGKSYRVQGDVPRAVFASYLIRVRPSPELTSAFLTLFFQGADYWAHIHAQSRGIGRPAVNGTSLGALRVPVPTIEAQHEAVREAERLLGAVRETREMLTGRIDTADQLRTSILFHALAGGLTPDEANTTRAVPAGR